MNEKPYKPGIDFEAGQIRFDYVKSNLFRVIHVDGVFGGISPGNLHMTFWNERWPIPKQSVFKFDLEKQKIGQEIREERVERQSVIREVEIHVIMDIDNAKALKKWLETKIEEVEKISQISNKGK